MVKPNNLAVEYCALKWPEQKYEENYKRSYYDAKGYENKKA